jgi:glycosyltransferase involved in cell wall biosynthesis
MDQVNVTVCIPYHNESKELLGRAINSVLNQTRPPTEIIVVDDGSRFPHIPLEFVDETVRVARVTNRGLPAARNTALMLARCSYFLPLDSDDWIEPTYIEKTLPLAVAGADVVLVGLQEYGETRQSSYMPGYDRHPDEVTEKVLWQMNRFFYCALFRTNLLREVGGYHSQMAGWPGVSGGYEDWDLWIDLKRRDARFDCVNEILLNYTTSPDGMLAKAERNREQLVNEMHRHHET